MKIVVKYYTVMCMAAGYCREEEIILEDRRNIYTLLQFISEKHGGKMKKYISALLAGEKNIIWIFINGRRIKDDKVNIAFSITNVCCLKGLSLFGTRKHVQ